MSYFDQIPKLIESEFGRGFLVGGPFGALLGAIGFFAYGLGYLIPEKEAQLDRLAREVAKAEEQLKVAQERLSASDAELARLQRELDEFNKNPIRVASLIFSYQDCIDIDGCRLAVPTLGSLVFEGYFTAKPELSGIDSYTSPSPIDGFTWPTRYDNPQYSFAISGPSDEVLPKLEAETTPETSISFNWQDTEYHMKAVWLAPFSTPRVEVSIYRGRPPVPRDDSCEVPFAE